MKALRIIDSIFLLLITLIFIISCAINPVTGKKQLMLMSEAQEDQLGKQYDPQIMATFGEYKNDKLLAFAQSKANEMGKISHRPRVQYRVRLIDSPVVNAFAIPGGYIYLTRGILANFNSEAELAGVLGHEMGHIAARHSASQQSKQQLGQLLLMGGMIASEKFAQYAQYAMQGMQLLFLKYSRDDETQADRLGVAYSSKIGYDAHQMANFFKVLEQISAESGSEIPTFMSTHPDPGDRFERVNQQATAWQDSLKLSDWKVNTNSYLGLIDGIVYGEDPRQGYVDNSVFYHPVLKFKFNIPAGWRVENQPAQVNMAPTDGNAIIVFTVSQTRSLQEAARTTFREMELKPSESKKTTINGMPALVTLSQHVTADQSTGQNQTNYVTSCFIDYGKTIYVFHGVTTQADYNNYKDQFVTTMTSFSKLTDRSKLNVKPQIITIRKVQQTGTLADALSDYNVPKDKMKELSLLNNTALNETVQQGRLIKIFE